MLLAGDWLDAKRRIHNHRELPGLCHRHTLTDPHVCGTLAWRHVKLIPRFQRDVRAVGWVRRVAWLCRTGVVGVVELWLAELQHAVVHPQRPPILGLELGNHSATPFCKLVGILWLCAQIHAFAVIAGQIEQLLPR